jgi:ubiquinone/menaquinone biosynthesis C-methylase UbiE
MAVGRTGADRLALLDRAYGPGTRRLLEEVGLAPGMKVVDVGCGIGSVTRWIADRVGPTGSVIGIDRSAESLRVARERTAQPNVEYVEASAFATGLPRGAFDVAFSRLLLKHVDRPEDAVAEMRALLRPGGRVACEEAVIESSSCDPPAPAHQRLQELSTQMFARNGTDWQVARRLYQLIVAQGFTEPCISYHQPVYARGEEKRFEELSFREVGGRMTAMGIAGPEEIASVADAVARVVDDETVVYSLSRMTQVWAIKE